MSRKRQGIEPKDEMPAVVKGVNPLRTEPNPNAKSMPLDQWAQIKRANRMAKVDALSPEQRACVHEYGFPVVHTLMEFGIQNPRHIRHIVETILNEFSPTRGSFSRQGIRTEVV